MSAPDEPKGYRWRVVDAVEASVLPAIARHVLLTLANHADVTTGELGENSPSLTRLAQWTGWKPTAVKAHLLTLEAGGWLVRRRPPVAAARAQKERTRYAVRIPGEAPGMPVSSRSPHDLEQKQARSPHDLALGRHTTMTRSSHGHEVDQADQADRGARQRRRVSQPTAGVQRCPACQQPVAADDGSCACEARR